MTDTDTTAAPAVTHDRLTLVTVSDAEYDHVAASRGMREHPHERTFFATVTRESDGTPIRGFVSLLVPTTDPRSAGMHAISDGRYDDLIGGGSLTRSDYRQWCLSLNEVTRADVVELEREYHERQAEDWTVRRYDDDRPLAVGDRVRVESVHAPQWNGEGTVTSTYNDGSAIVHMETGEHTGDDGAFSGERLTRITSQEPSEASQEPSQEEVRTFTREEVDAAVREAVSRERQEAEEALQRFKTEANRIAVEYAESNDLCGNFERCMSDIGLLGREEWHDQHDPEWTVTFTVTVRSDDDEAARWRAADLAYNMSTTELFYASEAEQD